METHHILLGNGIFLENDIHLKRPYSNVERDVTLVFHKDIFCALYEKKCV